MIATDCPEVKFCLPELNISPEKVTDVLAL